MSVEEFLDQHLPRCSYEGPVRHNRSDHRALLGHLLAMLRGHKAIAALARAKTAVQASLHRTLSGVVSVAEALHSYFRYRASLGDAVHGLVGAVSAPANWRLATLSKALTEQEVEQLIAALGEPLRWGVPTRSCAEYWTLACVIGCMARN